MHDGPSRPWQRATLRNGALEFEQPSGLFDALNDGFFFVRQPSGMSLTAGDRFANSFHLPQDPAGSDPFRGFKRFTPDRIGDRQGYFCREADQTEQFFLESRFWEGTFPGELRTQAAAMRDYALDILAGVLPHLDLPRPLWDRATGHALSGRGTYHLTFNHFRPEVNARGLNVHKDSGWVTVLRSLEPGLEVRRGGRWEPIDPEPGWFIVNFGCAMEILTRDSATPVAAVAHRVRQQTSDRSDSSPDRFSYALFVDSSLDENLCPGLFRYAPGTGLVLAGKFATFLDEIVHSTYEPDGVGLY
ncbi:2OG-Fe(II) oxygenase family protein [Streptomyces ossamyceticus]|uniref:2OG-Fe(II) oxygenase family protein n=1 Tax=Streptomyces ossamyceticus TaxID=249581 RepID=UPI0006E43DD7|nr:2OG-Fe(II) oxygenase family protein [Streptomyces ossamyceticus]